MLASDLAKRLLVFTDMRTLAEANTAGVEYLESAVDAINQAAQYIYLKGPSSISIRDFGYQVSAQQDVVVSYTGSWTMTTGWSSAHTGKTFKVSGQKAYNRILRLGSSPAFTAEWIPADAIVGQSAILYHDAISLSSEIIEVLGGVTLDDTVTLRAATNEQNLFNESCVYGASDYGRQFPTQVAARPPSPGQPRAYYIASINPSSDSTTVAQQSMFMRLCPYPTDAHLIRFRARVRPPKVATADLDAANNGAACTKQVAIPSGFDEMFLLPIAKQFFTGSAFFNNNAQKEEIARAAKAAMEDLDLMRGQASRPLVFKPQV